MAAGRASLGEKNPKMLIMNPDIIVIIPNDTLSMSHTSFFCVLY